MSAEFDVTPDFTAGATVNHQKQEPRRTLDQEGKDNSSLLLLPDELQFLDTLTKYYQTLSRLGQDGPTLEEVTAYRLFLASLLQKLTGSQSKQDPKGYDNNNNNSNNYNSVMPTPTLPQGPPVLLSNTPGQGRGDATPYPTPEPSPPLDSKNKPVANPSSHPPEGVADIGGGSDVYKTPQFKTAALHVPTSRPQTVTPSLTPTDVVLFNNLVSRSDVFIRV